MPMFIPPALISLRSRKPLIMVVLCLSCPAIFVLIVILKSPRIGWSVSGLRCAKEIAVAREIAKAMTANRSNLVFTKCYLCILLSMYSFKQEQGECEQPIKKPEVTQPANGAGART